MLVAEPKPLLEQLNPVCTRAVERGAGACITSRHYEVTSEHLLLALLEDPESDVGRHPRAIPCRVLARPRCAPTPARGAALRATQGGPSSARSSSSGSRTPGSTPRRSSATDACGPARSSFGSCRRRPATSRQASLGSRRSRAMICERTCRSGPLQSGEAASTTPKAAGRGAWHGAAAHSAEGGALARFTTNLTERATKGGLDPVFGREAEVRQVVDILCRRRKNNPIIVGEPGVGKTALVEGLALRIAQGDVPAQLKRRATARPRPRGAAGGRWREGGVREPAPRRHHRGEGVARAHRPLHRRGAHDHRRGRAARGSGTRQIFSSRPSRAASCARSRRPPGPSTSATSRRTPRSSGAFSR